MLILLLTHNADFNSFQLAISLYGFDHASDNPFQVATNLHDVDPASDA